MEKTFNDRPSNDILRVYNKICEICVKNAKGGFGETLSPVEFIGYTRVRRNDKDWWVGPEVWGNNNAIPYHPACCPTNKQMREGIERAQKTGLKLHVEHFENLEPLGRVTGMKIVNGYTRDDKTFQSLLVRGVVRDTVKNGLLKDVYRVTSLYDLGWSLQYTLVWKSKVINNVEHKAIDYVILKEISLTKEPRFMDCRTRIAGNNKEGEKCVTVYCNTVRKWPKLSMAKVHYNIYKYEQQEREKNCFKNFFVTQLKK